MHRTARTAAWLREAVRSKGRIRLLAEIGLAFAGVIWGVNFVLVKVAIERMPPFYYLGLRFLVGAIVPAPFCIGRLRRMEKRGWLLTAGLGALLFGGFALQTVGLQTTSPGMSRGPGQREDAGVFPPQEKERFP